MIRFWATTVDGNPVRFSIAAGQTIVVEGGGPTDEGHYYRESRYTLDGDHLMVETYTNSRDCDGYYTGASTNIARVDQLEHYPELYYGDHRRLWALEQAQRPVHFPDWTNVDDYWRDHSAEAAGY